MRYNSPTRAHVVYAHDAFNSNVCAHCGVNKWAQYRSLCFAGIIDFTHECVGSMRTDVIALACAAFETMIKEQLCNDISLQPLNVTVGPASHASRFKRVDGECRPAKECTVVVQYPPIRVQHQAQLLLLSSAPRMPCLTLSFSPPAPSPCSLNLLLFARGIVSLPPPTHERKECAVDMHDSFCAPFLPCPSRTCMTILLHCPKRS